MKKILFVYAKGGAPLEHSLPRIAQCGELHILAFTPLPTAAEDEWGRCVASIVDASDEHLIGEAVVERIVERTTAINAEAIMCLSEFAVLAVSEAAKRLGLAGAGGNAHRSRDKRLMREVWRDAGVPIPHFRRVDSEADLHSAFAELRNPLLLKPAWGAGSIGQIVLHDENEVGPAWRQVKNAVRHGEHIGYCELLESDTDQHLLVEEIVVGSTDGWYEGTGYGDYLSVEGVVVDGTYYPICITSRIPTIPPFTELSNNAPCVLTEALQRRIEDVARRCVDALELGTCGTHTEIKLAANEELFVIESAARFGGCMVTKEVEMVFEIDPIATLTKTLLGESIELPNQMLVEGKRAAASLALLPTDAQGRPWTTNPVWDSNTADIGRLVSDESTITAVKGLTVPNGTLMPSYDPSAGAGNWSGIFFLTAPDAATLLTDCHRVLNGLESLLNNVCVKSN